MGVLAKPYQRRIASWLYSHNRSVWRLFLYRSRVLSTCYTIQYYPADEYGRFANKTNDGMAFTRIVVKPTNFYDLECTNNRLLSAHATSLASDAEWRGSALQERRLSSHLASTSGSQTIILRQRCRPLQCSKNGQVSCLVSALALAQPSVQVFPTVLLDWRAGK